MRLLSKYNSSKNIKMPGEKDLFVDPSIIGPLNSSIEASSIK